MTILLFGATDSRGGSVLDVCRASDPQPLTHGQRHRMGHAPGAPGRRARAWV